MATAVDLTTLKKWISENLHHGMKLPVMRHEVKEQKKGGWESQSIEPATPLSCILYLTDPMYSHIPANSRPGILRETCTDLESSFTTILKGRKFPVRRTAEAIIAASTGGPSTCSALGLNALCRLYEFQFVWFDEGQKLIKFYPEEVSEWTMEKPVHFISSLANQVWIPPSAWSQASLVNWLAEKENDGWKVNYDEADGSMEELKDLCKKLNYSPATKLNKADLGKKLGRIRAIKELGKWVVS